MFATSQIKGWQCGGLRRCMQSLNGEHRSVFATDQIEFLLASAATLRRLGLAMLETAHSAREEAYEQSAVRLVAYAEDRIARLEVLLTKYDARR